MNQLPQKSSPGMSALDRLALHAVNLKASAMPGEVLDKARLCIIDALSSCLTVGSTLESNCALTLAAAYDARGVATIFGTSIASSAGAAAFVNGVSAASTSRSDTHSATASHPGPVIIPTVLALAEARRRSGQTVMEALVGGYEVMGRIGLALITPEFASIFRPTGFIAPTAAAIAAGRVIGLSATALRNAGGLATHTAAGLNEWTRSGTSEFVYHSGFAARNGVDCALLAEAGTISAPTMLEGSAGLLAGYGAAERADRLTDRLADKYEILEILHKPAPACVFVQTPCQIARSIVRDNSLDLESIRRIEIRTSRAAAMYPGCDDRGPIVDPQAAKLSIQFSVASVLVAGGIFDANWRNFTDPRVNALAARSVVIIDPDLTAAFPARQGSRIEIELMNGEVIRTEQDDFVCMSESDVTERFLNVAEPRLGASRSHRVLELIGELERLDDICVLTSALRTS